MAFERHPPNQEHGYLLQKYRKVKNEKHKF
jgi:hypothetical protein